MSRKPVEVASKEKNEYIPSFITKKPFWVPDDESTSAADYLEHQRLQKELPDQSKWYDRGKRTGPAATKYRKGACENCGAMTHKTKECLSRPRKKGARFTGKDIQADEVVQDVNLGWDAKRDRWNGWNSSDYSQVIQDFEELEKMKRLVRGEDNNDDKEPGKDDEGEKEIEDELKYAEESDMGRQQSTSTRNLRIREDTAKYLLNLDLESAKYDPKTRSMVDIGAQIDQASALVAEDNFMRASGDAAEFEKAQKYAWESQERGGKNKIHIQANPTSGEYLRRKEEEEAAARKEAQRKALLQKYGGELHLKPSTLKNVAVMENDRYVEYDETGAIKGAPEVEQKSKYPEDVYINNHTSVWGSWWKNFEWGYTCCYSTVRNSYCTGAEGKQALEEANNLLNRGVHEAIEDAEQIPSGESKGEKKETPAVQSKKRSALEMQSGVTEEELEAYKRSRTQSDDPMASLLGKDELVH
ncbi:mRNA splicing protein [Thelotrema lepadinum]|nr:mRNA splicing protein [Thelotrema lepadinum]